MELVNEGLISKIRNRDAVLGAVIPNLRDPSSRRLETSRFRRACCPVNP